ncbi:MAG: DASS family sodium-coupled anion symporter [Candidatus Omnitrophica bacterium]|nr:DASS family sodium-coupled anion symporter [Candidatus Omnitrophota bacterium]
MQSIFRAMRKPDFIKGIGVYIFAWVIYMITPEGMDEAAKRQIFIFVVAALYWAMEIIPLYATSLMVVLLEMFMLCRPDGVLAMSKTGYQVFLLPFGSPIIMLFFGGFILARAMHKYHIDKWIASNLLKVFGHKPYMILFGFMVATALLSMWMSNTATTAMMMAMVIPLLKQLDQKDPYRIGLVLAIPFAANIGGIGTPVGTPPNAIAIGILADQGIQVNFLSWMKMAVPLAMGMLILISALLYVMYPPVKRQLQFSIQASDIGQPKSIVAGVIALLTIILWLTSGVHHIPSAMVALMSAGVFAATGILDRDDFKLIDWDVLVLMWGGLAMGKGLELTGLTKWIVDLPLFDQQGFVLVAVFCILAIVLSTFMSNTATANLIIPIVMAIPGENPILMATTIALSCSFAMALPISTPPNAIAFASNMIKSRHMLLSGSIVSVISLLMVLLGYRFIITKALGLE